MQMNKDFCDKIRLLYFCIILKHHPNMKVCAASVITAIFPIVLKNVGPTFTVLVLHFTENNLSIFS